LAPPFIVGCAYNNFSILPPIIALFLRLLFLLFIIAQIVAEIIAENRRRARPLHYFSAGRSMLLLFQNY
jgi:hypothetical protein